MAPQMKIYYGDSITAAAGAQTVLGPTGVYYPWLIAFEKRQPNFMNFAVNGHATNDQADFVYGHAVAPGDEFFYMLGTNDRKIYGASAGALALYRGAVSAAIYWLGGNKKIANSSEWTWTGSSWLPQSLFGGTFSMGTSHVGDYGEITFTGDLAVLSYILVDGFAWSFSVSIDGVNKGTFSLLPPTTINAPGSSGRAYAPALLRFPGNGGGTHTLRVTAVSGGVGINWLGTGPVQNVVRVLTQPRDAVQFHANDDADVAAYNGVLSDVVMLAANDGYNVLLIDSGSKIDPANDLADGVHPNNRGHMKIGAEILRAIEQ